MAKGSFVTRIPLTIPSCVAWIDAANISDTSILSSGNSVSSWLDQSGNKNHATQATTGSQPKTNTRTISGKNAIDFDGVDDFLTFTSNKAVSAPFTIFVVAQVDTTAGQTIIGRQTAATAGQWTLIKNGSFNIFQTYGFGSGGIAGGGVKTYNSNPNIHTVSFGNGTTAKYQLNNDTIASDNVVVNGYDNNVATPLVIGSSVGTSGFMKGCIGEIVIYSRILTTNEISFINRYLSNKWGIAIS